jgi:uncharacterized protein (UPF0216 family)
MKRSVEKLIQTAKQRFPCDKETQDIYINLHYKYSDKYDDNSYYIDRQNWSKLKQEVEQKYGQRKRLRLDFVEECDKSSRIRSAGNFLINGVKGGAKYVKAIVGVDPVTPEQKKERLDVCRNCPGNHAVWAIGGKKIKKPDDKKRKSLQNDPAASVYTCGPMLESLKKSGQGTCGCILDKKASLKSESCPFGYWPTLDGEDIKEKSPD